MRKRQEARSMLKGISFGLTSGVITTMGAIVGIYAGSESRLAVMAGVLSIAFADAMSDALGIHVSEESQTGIAERNIWRSTIATLLSKLLVASSFVVPFFLGITAAAAVVAGIVWGFMLLSIFSAYLARRRNAPAWPSIIEHITLAVIVILLTHYIGIFLHRRLAG